MSDHRADLDATPAAGTRTPGRQPKPPWLRVRAAAVDLLLAATAGISGVRRLSFQAQQGGPGGPDLEIRVRGSDFEQQPGRVFDRFQLVWIRGRFDGLDGIVAGVQPERRVARYE